jgi:hypothetical protein
MGPRSGLSQAVSVSCRQPHVCRDEAIGRDSQTGINLEEAGTTKEAITRGISTRQEKPILYLSRTLRAYEKNYTILELEMGAVVWSVLKLQRYLDGTPFTVVTDHQPIIQVVESSSRTITSPRVERWRMLLQPYVGQMTFVHKAGKLHGNVDALSRLPREPKKDEEARTVSRAETSIGLLQSGSCATLEEPPPSDPIPLTSSSVPAHPPPTTRQISLPTPLASAVCRLLYLTTKMDNDRRTANDDQPRQTGGNLIGYVDCAYGDCQETRRSTAGYVFSFGRRRRQLEIPSPTNHRAIYCGG